jgi:hypothetical protein
MGSFDCTQSIARIRHRGRRAPGSLPDSRHRRRARPKPPINAPSRRHHAIGAKEQHARDERCRLRSQRRARCRTSSSSRDIPCKATGTGRARTETDRVLALARIIGVRSPCTRSASFLQEIIDGSFDAVDPRVHFRVAVGKADPNALDFIDQSTKLGGILISHPPAGRSDLAAHDDVMSSFHLVQLRRLNPFRCKLKAKRRANACEALARFDHGHHHRAEDAGGCSIALGTKAANQTKHQCNTDDYGQVVISDSRLRS